MVPLHGVGCLHRQESSEMDETSSAPLVLSGWAGEVENFHFSCECGEACRSVSPALPFCWGLSHGLASSAC